MAACHKLASFVAGDHLGAKRHEFGEEILYTPRCATQLGIEQVREKWDEPACPEILHQGV
ncbi:MAG TPA: hypothetical protein VF705_15200 [Longimicrobium sp.]